MLSQLNNYISSLWASGNSNSEGDSTYYPRSSRDVQLVYLVLRRFLFPELIPGILDEAEYWVKQSSEETTPAVVRERQGNLTYLNTPLLASPFRPIRRIIFTVMSRDQGWSDYRADHGTYNNSWSWFEAHLVGPAPADEANDDLPPGEVRTVLASRLITNLHAARWTKEHVVVWDSNSQDATIRHTLKTMGVDDTIELVARAQFGGWANFVQSASIEVFVSAFRYTT